jgi:hypothetical protein
MKFEIHLSSWYRNFALCAFFCLLAALLAPKSQVTAFFFGLVIHYAAILFYFTEAKRNDSVIKVK